MGRTIVNPRNTVWVAFKTAFAALLIGLASGIPTASADDEDIHGQFCSRTASTQLAACQAEVRDDYYVARAVCINVSDASERSQCIAESKTTFRDGNRLCRDQNLGRRDVCRLVGEARYDPDFDPVEFDGDFANPTHPNPYFPLTIGHRWEYMSNDGESNVIEMTNKTKLIEGVTCIVSPDLAKQDGKVIEDSDDWYALARNGAAWYCGEVVRNFETFPGDNPEEPELVNLGGSWKHARDGAKAGIIFPADPVVGLTYRQEFALSNAEDLATVVSTSYGYGRDAALDNGAPRTLVEFLCNGDCVVTRESTPIEPGKFQYKYYARGIGLFLDVNSLGELNGRLVNCNFDSRCGALPTP